MVMVPIEEVSAFIKNVGAADIIRAEVAKLSKDDAAKVLQTKNYRTLVDDEFVSKLVVKGILQSKEVLGRATESLSNRAGLSQVVPKR